MKNPLDWVWRLVLLTMVLSGHAQGAEPGTQAPSATIKTVLVLNGERSEIPANELFESELRQRLERETGEIELYVEYLDFGRFPLREHQEDLLQYLRNRYKGMQFDAVVLYFEAAVEFGLAHRAELFPRVPIVAAGVDKQWLARVALPENSAAVPISLNYRRTLEMVLAMQPDAREVVIVHGVSDFDLRRREEARRAVESFGTRLTHRALGGMPLAQIEDEVRRLPPTSVVLMTTMVRDAEGKAYMGRNVAARLAAVSPVPVFTTLASHQEAGAVGGAITDFAAVGRTTAAAISRLLADGGTRRAAVIDLPDPPLLVNWPALQRWHIPESRVPREAQILLRPPSMWEQHRVLVMVIAIAILLQALVITSLVSELARRRHAERTLRESEARFRSMADTAPVLIWMAGADSLCTFFNTRWLDFTGRTLQQELGNGWTQGVHPEDLERCLRDYRTAFGARHSFNMEYRLRRHDGEYRWVDDNGAPRYESDGRFLGYIGSCVDITERKRAEEKFRLAASELPVAVMLIDQQGRIVLANVKAEKLFGYDHDELLGRGVDTLVPQSVRGGHSGRRAEFHANPQVRLIGAGRELFARRKDGSEFMAEVSLNPVESEEGMLVLTLIVDLTEHHELQRSRHELAHAARVSVMGELAGSLAHELNQPLTAILSNAQAAQHFMLADSTDLSELREILRDVIRDGNRASEVIRRMRALVRKGEMEVASLDPGDMVRDVAALVHSDAIVRGVRVVLDVEPDLPAVRGDRVQLQQVMLNLLLNAFDAMKGCPREERVAEVQVARDAIAGVRILVRDSGTGLTGDKLDSIFTPFFTTKRDGLGLGLSISRSIIEAHGAHLRAENNADRGAAFYFTLPVAEMAHAGAAGRLA